MNVIEKNQGKKIDYAVVGTTIVFDDDLSINCAKRQSDNPVHEDICYDERGMLVVGAAAGRRYVAEIDIPKREYIYHEPVSVHGDEADGAEMMESEPPTPVPLNMDNVTLTLWAIE